MDVDIRYSHPFLWMDSCLWGFKTWKRQVRFKEWGSRVGGSAIARNWWGKHGFCEDHFAVDMILVWYVIIVYSLVVFFLITLVHSGWIICSFFNEGNLMNLDHPLVFQCFGRAQFVDIYLIFFGAIVRHWENLWYLIYVSKNTQHIWLRC